MSWKFFRVVEPDYLSFEAANECRKRQNRLN